MPFKSDANISEPVEDSGFVGIADMNGFGWDPDEGLFIPTPSPVDYFEKPHVTDLLRRVANGSR